MLRSILVPLDGTPFSERSLPLAVEVARAGDATIHLARVHEPDAPPGEGEAEYLHGVEERLRNGIEVDSTLLEEGDVSDQLRDHADRVEADAIFITSHARGGIERVLLGSVANRILRTSHVPVFIVHPIRRERDVDAPSEIKHILVPLDWSNLAGVVFAPVADLAKMMNARVTLTSVVTPVIPGPKMVPIDPDAPDDDEVRAARYLEEMAEDLRAEGLSVDVLVVSAKDPARGIVSVAEECGADLVAMATHGYSGVKRALAGSVAERVLHSSRLPMMVMRAPGEA